MGWKCCAPECFSGYDSGPEIQREKFSGSFHKFPTDPDLRNKWIRKIRREKQEPSNNSRVCSLHFKEDDFQAKSTDSNKKRKRRLFSENDNEIKKKVLKPDAVPSVFPNLATYYNELFMTVLAI